MYEDDLYNVNPKKSPLKDIYSEMDWFKDQVKAVMNGQDPKPYKPATLDPLSRIAKIAGKVMLYVAWSLLTILVCRYVV